MKDAPKPTSKQLSFLKSLAEKTGTSFTHPQTRSQASAEINRLMGRRSTTNLRTEAGNARRDRRAVLETMHSGQLSAVDIREDEIRGYGSNATWA